MERITVTLDAEILGQLDASVAARGYPSRSEALRDILRERFGQEQAAAAPGATCVAALTYVFDHRTRDLAGRLAQGQHDRHDLTVASLHVHLDHEACLEVAVLRGSVAEVRALADGLTTQSGVRFGHLHVVPALIAEADHAHGPAGNPHVHVEA